ncbi:MAG: hypothetical protein IPO15_22090 [Anaerolineae bacterium]|uniref:hypothetical protein n=1 Tax=Candidatus Amarolinea dominans TaxID=3140696 RepID=UPI0031362EF2|nr:hypothetical protein [Anaerolineae bacterium]
MALVADGTSALGNHETGIVLSGSSNNLIGGNTPAQRNIISANGAEGIIIADASAHNVVSGNYIGTDASGTLGRGNAGTGAGRQWTFRS